MTYMTTTRRSSHRGARARAIGLSGMFDGFFSSVMEARNVAISAENAEQMRCLDQANNSSQVKAIDAKIEDLARTWNPTGVYTSPDVVKLYTALESATDQARAALASAPLSTGDAKEVIGNAVAYLDNNDRRIAAYKAAVATSGGAKIPAPDLKRELLKSLVNVSHAYTTVAVLACRTTWLDRAYAVIDRVIQIAKSVVGTIVQIGEKVAKAIIAPLDIIGWLGRHPYVPVGIAAIILFKRFGVKV